MVGMALGETIMQVDVTPTLPRSKKTDRSTCSTSAPRKTSIGTSGGSFQM